MRGVIRSWAVFAAAAALFASAVSASASFPGVNGKIVFSSNRTGYFEIYSMNPDGSGVTQLTNLKQCSRGPWVAADGRIAFHNNPNPSCSGTDFQIYTMNADGSGVTQLTSGSYNVTPAWSPTGRQIAFVSNRTGSCQIFVMNADGTGQHSLTKLNPQGLGGVSWSPDGSKIVYGTAVISPQCPGPSGLANLQIHVMSANGNSDQTLESEPFDPTIGLNTSRHPDWSPDGSQITYASTRSGDLQIWTMNADGSGQVQVTQDPNTAENFSRFSPDGTELVFEAVWSQGVEIRSVNADGSHEVSLASGKTRNIQPSWGPAN